MLKQNKTKCSFPRASTVPDSCVLSQRCSNLHPGDFQLVVSQGHWHVSGESWGSVTGRVVGRALGAGKCHAMHRTAPQPSIGPIVNSAEVPSPFPTLTVNCKGSLNVGDTNAFVFELQCSFCVFRMLLFAWFPSVDGAAAAAHRWGSGCGPLQVQLRGCNSSRDPKQGNSLQQIWSAFLLSQCVGSSKQSQWYSTSWEKLLLI